MNQDKHKKKTSFDKKWQNQFKNYAIRFNDDAGIAGWSKTGLDARFRYFQKISRNEEFHGFWLDAGCGAGTYTRYLQNKGSEVFGLDYSYYSIIKARERSEKGIGWAVGDIKSLPFETNTFDKIICFGVMQAISEGAVLVSEVHRVLKPTGKIWLDSLNSLCIPHILTQTLWKLRRRPMHLRYDSPFKIRKTMEENQFLDTKIYWLPIVPKKLLFLQPLVESKMVHWLFQNIPFIGAMFSHSFIVSGRKSL